MGDANPIRTLGDYSKPSHEGYRNTIELPVGNNMVPLRSDTIRGKLHDRNVEESWALLEDLTLYDNESWNDPRDFAKPIKAISLPQDVPSTSDWCLIELDNQVQCLMEAHLALTRFQTTTKRDDQQKRHYIKTITERIAGALPSDTVKNPKLNVNPTTSVLSARSYPTEDPQCSTYIYGLINTITIHPKQQSNSHDSKAKEEEREREGNPEGTDTIPHNEEQRDTPQLELKDTTAVDNLGPNKDDKGIEWLNLGVEIKTRRRRVSSNVNIQKFSNRMCNI
ncbi:hypothetical protein Tco_1050722 [Tanacetum coccineum]